MEDAEEAVEEEEVLPRCLFECRSDVDGDRAFDMVGFVTLFLVLDLLDHNGSNLVYGVPLGGLLGEKQFSCRDQATTLVENNPKSRDCEE